MRYIPYSFSLPPLLFLIGNSNSMLKKGIWEKNALDVQIRKMLSRDHNLIQENSFLCLFRHVSKTFHLASGHLMISLSLACQTKQLKRREISQVKLHKYSLTLLAKYSVQELKKKWWMLPHPSVSSPSGMNGIYPRKKLLIHENNEFTKKEKMLQLFLGGKI